MDPAHRALLRRNTVFLSGELRVSESIVPLLFQEQVLTEAQVDHIESASSERLKTRRLLQLLPSRGPRAFGCFLNSLDHYSWVRDALQAELSHGTGTGSEPEPGPGPGQKTGPTPDPSDVPQLSDSVLLRVPSDRELSRLASRLGPDWEAVLLDLGLSAEALFRCRSDHSLSVQAAALSGLIQWRRSEGKKATFQRLKESLQNSEVHLSVLQEVVL